LFPQTERIDFLANFSLVYYTSLLNHMPNRIKHKRFFRKFLARSLQVLSHRGDSDQQFTGKLGSLAILATEKLGDSVLLTPLLRNLRHHFPELEIHVICVKRASADFFRNDPHVTAVHFIKEFVDYTRNVLSRNFDLLFNVKDGPSTTFLLQTFLIHARFKVGHQNPYHDGLFNHLLQVDFDTNMALKNCSLLPVLAVSVSKEECRPYLPPAAVSSAVTECISKIEKGLVIGLNISAGGVNRYWIEEKWSALIARFPAQQFMIFSAPDDREMKLRLEKAHENVTFTPPTGNIYEAGLLVKVLRLLVTPDTSLVHIASCYNTPVIGLYTNAPAEQSRFGPFLIEYELIVSATPQVSDIDTDAVASALQRHLP
jgi:ADP-heptose:LPS heptosyltransferase